MWARLVQGFTAGNRKAKHWTYTYLEERANGYIILYIKQRGSSDMRYCIFKKITWSCLFYCLHVTDLDVSTHTWSVALCDKSWDTMVTVSTSFTYIWYVNAQDLLIYLPNLKTGDKLKKKNVFCDQTWDISARVVLIPLILSDYVLQFLLPLKQIW